MVKLSVLAGFGLSLAARALGSEISNELENHYNGYPHTTPSVPAGFTSQTTNQPQVNSFIPLVFSYQAVTPASVITPPFGKNLSALITTEINGGPGNIPTYLFTGQKPAVANNYPSLIPPVTTGRKLLQTVAGTYTNCLAPAPANTSASGGFLVPITSAQTSPSWENYKAAACTNGANTTNAVKATGRRLLQTANRPIRLKLYGEVKKSSSTGFPVLTYVFDFTTRPTLTLLTKTQPVGSVPAAGTIKFVDCVIFLPDGAFARSKPGTCFDDTPVVNGVPQPVIVRLAAKSFYYSVGTLGLTTASQAAANTNRGTQVTPIAGFSVNFADTVGAPAKSLVFLSTANGGTSTIVQTYGVYVDASGVYPGQN